MSIVGSNVLAGASGSAGAAGYEITRSLRFERGDSAYLNRTPSSAGSSTTFTQSFWYKAVINGNRKYIQTVRDSSGNHAVINFQAGDVFEIYYWNQGGSTLEFQLISSAVFRDPSAWQHFVVAYDTTQSTAADRIKIYVNGTQLTDFSTANYPTQNFSAAIWNTTNPHYIGQENGAYSSFYIAEYQWVDGQALAATDFGEYDDNNVWQPIEYAGTYGTNGFHLDFSDNSSASALGTDSSGNSNTWTVNNISVASGAGNDSLVDSPTNGTQTDTGAGNEVVGNYATLNPLDKGSGGTLSNGNLDYTSSSSGPGTIRGTIGVSSGKWYWEVTISSIGTSSIGIADQSLPLTSELGNSSQSYGYLNDARKYNNGGVSSYGATYTTGDVIGVALDLDAGTLTFYKNGVSQGQAFSGISSGPYFPGLSDFGSVTTWNTNFGQRAFAYTPPTNHLSLCTTNLPDPTIADGSTAMDVSIWSGNSTARDISGLNMSPDLVWMKKRNSATLANHTLFDAVRGATLALVPNDSQGENAETTQLTAFNSDGFSLGASTLVNGTSYTYVGWAWDAGSSTVSNTDGSITSTVRANASAGLSIVKWNNGGGGAQNVGHGLGVAPELWIFKPLDTSGSWFVYHKSIGTGKYLRLERTDAQVGTLTYWTPTATTMNIATNLIVGTSSDMVAYCWSPVEGYSAFGSYTGNGSGDGPFVYTGFKVAFLILKQTDATGNWSMYDAGRDNRQPLYPNLSASEGTLQAVSFLSNGFKLDRPEAFVNASGGTYLYLAFAEHPFKTSRAR